MDILLKNGLVINEDGSKKMDILIRGDRISKIAENIEENEVGEVHVHDCTDRLIFPGFIDAHTHFDLDVAGTTTIDGFESGTRAAILGGTTTVVDFAHQYKGESLNEGLGNWHKKADGKAYCDYGFHLGITEWNDKVSKELEDVVKNGVTSFKLYMTYDVMVDDREMMHILNRLKELKCLVGAHCENDGMIKALRENVKDKKSVSNHYKTRPDITEAEAVSRYIDIGTKVDIPLMVVHLTNRRALDVARIKRKNGRKVYLETCPQYLLMNQSLYDRPDASKYVISPPLRTRDDNSCLWEAIKNHEIDTIATDHCSFSLKQKALGDEDYTKIPGGMPGVEDRVSLMYTYGVLEDRMSLNDLAKLLSTNPAKLYGMYPEKGVIKEGSRADITIINPNKKRTLSKETEHSLCDYVPLDGVKVACTIQDVFLGGKWAVKNEELNIGMEGSFIRRGLPIFI